MHTIHSDIIITQSSGWKIFLETNLELSLSDDYFRSDLLCNINFFKALCNINFFKACLARN